MEERNFIVYKHTSPSNKVYIGITNQKVNRRFRKGKGYSNNKHFFNAIEKYGWDNFQHEILFENFTKEEAKLMEQCYIALYNSYDSDKGYNNSLGGEGTYGFKPSSKTRKKLSEIHKKNWEDPKYREKMKERNKKMWENPERKEKQKERNKKMWENPEHRKNMSIKAKERWKNPEFQEKMKKINEIAKIKHSKKVICLSTNKVFNSISEAGKYYDIKSFSGIGRCCSGKRKYCGEYKDGIRLVWMYYDEYLKYDNENIQQKIQEAYKPQEPWNKGKSNIYTNETKSKIGEASKKLWENPEYKKKISKALGKKVICITTGKIFDSISEASKFYGLKSPSGIQKVCNNQDSYKTAGKLSDGTKLKWMYYEDYLKQISKEE